MLAAATARQGAFASCPGYGGGAGTVVDAAMLSNEKSKGRVLPYWPSIWK